MYLHLSTVIYSYIMLYIYIYIYVIYIFIIKIKNTHVCIKVSQLFNPSSIRPPSGSWWAPPHTSWPFAGLELRHDTTPWCQAPRWPRCPPRERPRPRRGVPHLAGAFNRLGYGEKICVKKLQKKKIILKNRVFLQISPLKTKFWD